MANPGANQRGLLDIGTFVVPRIVIENTIQFLQEVGSEGYEGFVLWGGQAHPEGSLRFTSVIIPEQHGMMTEKGLLVFVDGEALFKVNKTLYERNEILAGQVHTHPTSAYHSSTDDHYPLVTLLGAMSVVIPDFARNAPNDLQSWAWYRLGSRRRWELLTKKTRVVFE